MTRQLGEVAAARKLGEVADELRDVNERLVLSSIRAQESFEAAHQERARLRTLLETLHDGVAIVDGAGAVMMLNAAARTLMGQTADRALSDTLAASDFRRLDKTAVTPDEHPLARARRGESFLETELLLVRGNGEVRRVMVSCTVTLDGDRVALTIVVFRDITARRELEVRTAETERLAAIGRLAAGVAHEINNPLAVVMSNIDVLLEGIQRSLSMPLADRAELESMLEDAREGAERIRKVVRSLVMFAKPGDERRAVVDVRAVPETPSIASAAVVEAPPSRRGSVLVVDDEAPIARVLERLLRDHDVTVATSVDEALGIIETGVVFDVILSDLMMPGRSGMDFYEALGRVAPAHVPRVVFVSGGAYTPAAAEFIERVPNTCVRKPFEAGTIRSVVRQMLSGSPSKP
jgi:PAS domain S-box-containing protein